MEASGKRTIARWESKGGRYWVELYSDCTYRAGEGERGTAGGVLAIPTYAEALGLEGSEGYLVRSFSARVNMFQPGRNKTPMRMVLRWGV